MNRNGSAAWRASGNRLYLRDREDVDGRPIAGTEGGHSPFFSPDGLWLGFASGGFIRANTRRRSGQTPSAVRAAWRPIRIVRRLAGGDSALHRPGRCVDRSAKAIARGHDPHYLNSGRIVFTRAGRLYTAPFDLARLEVTGPAAPASEATAVSEAQNRGALAVAGDGTIVFVPATSQSGRLVVVDAHGGVRSAGEDLERRTRSR